MIILHQFAPHFGLPNASPFCMKVETWLRLAGLEYEVKRFDNPGKAPKGKLPMITDKGLNIPDSHFIIEYLRKTYDVKLDDGLDAQEKSIHHALRVMMEDHLYFTLTYTRWIDPANAPRTRDSFFDFLPGLIKPLVFALACRGVKKSLHGQGMGRHIPDEIYHLGEEDITALSDYLGKKKFFGGETPHEIDATAYAFLANFASLPPENRLRRRLSEHTNLTDYNKRMGERVFPEYNR